MLNDKYIAAAMPGVQAPLVVIIHQMDVSYQITTIKSKHVTITIQMNDYESEKKKKGGPRFISSFFLVELQEIGGTHGVKMQ